MREQITFENVRTQEQFDKLKQFAASDGVHRFDEHSIMPAVTMSRGSRMFGWIQVLNAPVVMPSFHLNECSPRDFVEASQQLKAIYQFSSINERFPNGQMWMAIPPSPMVDEDKLVKLGFEDVKRQLWQAVPKQ
jgi:hypothetical protein